MKNAKRLLAAALFLLSVSSVGASSACPLVSCQLPILVSNTCYVEFDPSQPAVLKRIVIHDPREPRACGVPLKLTGNGCRVTFDTSQPVAKWVTFDRVAPGDPTLLQKLTCPE